MPDVLGNPQRPFFRVGGTCFSLSHQTGIRKPIEVNTSASTCSPIKLNCALKNTGKTKLQAKCGTCALHTFCLLLYSVSCSGEMYTPQKCDCTNPCQSDIAINETKYNIIGWLLDIKPAIFTMPSIHRPVASPQVAPKRDCQKGYKRRPNLSVCLHQ